MEQLHFIINYWYQHPNIQIIDIINKDTHKEIIAKLDYDAPLVLIAEAFKWRNMTFKTF